MGSGDGGAPRSGLPSAPVLALIDLLRLDPDPLSGSGGRSLKLGWCTESKSGGRFTFDDEANAMASGPYGTPNLPNVSLEARNLTCSDVGPVRGYVNSVRVAVWVRGGEIESREIIEGEFNGPPSLFLDKPPVKKVNTEPLLEPLFRWVLPTWDLLGESCESAEATPDIPDRTEGGRECEGGVAEFWDSDRGESVIGSFIKPLLPRCGINLLKKPDTPVDREPWGLWGEVGSTGELRSIVS